VVDGLDNGPGEREAPLIYLVMGLHGEKCSTPEHNIQSVVALSDLPDFPSPPMACSPNQCGVPGIMLITGGRRRRELSYFA